MTEYIQVMFDHLLIQAVGWHSISWKKLPHIRHHKRWRETDMGIVLLGSGSIFPNLSGSSPNLKIFEANYELWGNDLASVNSRLMKMALTRHFFDAFCKHHLLFLILSWSYSFGSSTSSVWFRMCAASASNNFMSNTWMLGVKNF